MSLKPVNQKQRVLLLWVISISIGFCIICGAPLLPEPSVYHEVVEGIGMALVFVAVIGRLWSILYIGAKKNQELVVTGPYSLVRNPLYFFSICGLVGVGLMFGSLALAAGILFLSSIIFWHTAVAEAQYLRAKFGMIYKSYELTTPLLIPTKWNYADSATLTFSTKALIKTFYDCLPFVMAYPLIEFVEWARVVGFLKPLFHIP